MLVNEMTKAQLKIGIDASIWRIGEKEGQWTQTDSRAFRPSMNRFRLSGSIRSAIEKLPANTIFHAHDGFIPEYYAIGRFLKKMRPMHRLILSSHGSYSEARLRNLSPVNKSYFHFFEQSLIRNASLVHLVGPAEVSGFNFFVDGGTPFISMPNGLTVSELHESFNRDHLGNEVFVITFNGSLNVHEKGLDILLKSFATFSREVYSPAELWLIGAGKGEGELRQTASDLGISNKVKFCGDLDIHARKQRLAATHVFVQPSRKDCIPLTALEAAANGVPLIVTEETNLGGFVRQHEAGWFLSRSDVNSLTLALHEAYFTYQTDEESYLTRCYHAYRMIRDELNWNSLAHKWKGVYSSIQ